MAKKSAVKKRIVLTRENFNPFKQKLKQSNFKTPTEFDELYAQFREAYKIANNGAFISKVKFIERLVIEGSKTIFENLEY